MGLLESQISAALVLQNSRAAIIRSIKLMRKKYAKSSEEELELYGDLLALLDTSIEFGKLKYLHENTLSDDKGNTQKEG